jgi:hypothetical protein
VGQVLSDKDRQWLKNVMEHKDKYHKFWEEYQKKNDTYLKRLKRTWQVIKDNTKDAKETVKELIEAYKREYNRTYVVAEQQIKDFLEPLVQWLRNGTSSTVPHTKEVKDKRKETLRAIQKQLDKNYVHQHDPAPHPGGHEDVSHEKTHANVQAQANTPPHAEEHEPEKLVKPLLSEASGLLGKGLAKDQDDDDDDGDEQH